MSDTVRETKTPDELKPGDWLAAEMMTEGPAEVLHTYPYPDESGLQVVHVLVRELGKQAPYGDVLYGLAALELATEDELAALREQAERAQKIADIRALADWLEANPDMPMPYGEFYAYIDGQPLSDHGPEGMAAMRRIAEAWGEKLNERPVDHTTLARRFGQLTYELRCFHRDGRPDPEPDPTGLAYSRADDADDPTPVSGHRVEPHVGGVTDGGLVDETPPTSDLTGAAVTESCVFVGDKGGWCNTHEAVHIATGEAECGCPVYPFAGRGDGADTIVDHRFGCPDAA